MYQNRNEYKINFRRKPFLRYVGSALELTDDACCIETTAFQFNRHYPGFPVLFSDEYMIATFLAGWNP